MSVKPAFPELENPRIRATIARAELRRGKLERLSDVGMELADRIGAHAAAAMSAVNETLGGDPGRSFAAVSRAVRMTLALEERIDDRILALLRGDLPAASRARARPAPEATTEAEPTRVIEQAPDSRRDRLDDAVREAINLEVESVSEARERLDALHERLFDRENYDALLNLPIRDALAAICADLGLAPDWALWTDDAGFVAPPGRRRVDWTAITAASFPKSTPGAKSPTPHRRE